MNQNFKKLISAATLLCSAMTFPEACSTCPTTCGTGQNTWQPHAFNASMGREVLVGKHAWVAKEDGEGWHGHFSVAGEYDRTFKQSCTNVSGCCKSLGSLPLWASNNSNSITAGNNSGEYDLDLYQIGMGAVDTDAGKLTDTIILNPLVYQAGADFFLYVGSHQTERGFFLKMHAPVGVISVN
ncbi:hypothetical protein KBD08_04485, partial [Candidatus Babeliales bacterium]|nr:hypothetical protein [Candidatus Babeliales bacterium]